MSEELKAIPTQHVPALSAACFSDVHMYAHCSHFCLPLLLYELSSASLSPFLSHCSSFINLSQNNKASLCLSRSCNAGIRRSMQNRLLTLLLFINLLEMHSENPSIPLRLMTDWFIARASQHYSQMILSNCCNKACSWALKVQSYVQALGTAFLFSTPQ